jgi:hypothetical protein
MFVYLQVTYLDGPTIMHGKDMGDHSSPAGALSLEKCEQLVGIFGASGSLLYSIGFNTSLGRVYGPWGTSRGESFAYPGIVYGFYGGEKWGCIGGIGAWVAPPGPPLVPPPSLAPSPPPLPTRGMSKSPLFGSSTGPFTSWDDGPSHAGPSLFTARYTSYWGIASVMRHV